MKFHIEGIFYVPEDKFKEKGKDLTAWFADTIGQMEEVGIRPLFQRDMELSGAAARREIVFRVSEDHFLDIDKFQAKLIEIASRNKDIQFVRLQRVPVDLEILAPEEDVDLYTVGMGFSLPIKKFSDPKKFIEFLDKCLKEKDVKGVWGMKEIQSEKHSPILLVGIEFQLDRKVFASPEAFGEQLAQIVPQFGGGKAEPDCDGDCGSCPEKTPTDPN